MLDKYIDSFTFIIAFGVSMIIVYFMHPEPKVIYKFPNPDNSGKYTYQDDKTKSCYKYEATNVKCPSDPNLILEHPIIIK
jgi:hypothetical protein